MNSKKPVALIIMDGYALSEEKKGNAIELAGSVNIKNLMKNYPSSSLGASGMDVGLPEGQMGNSEVGHLNIGAGRVVYQELTRITKSIADTDFFTNKEICESFENAKKNGKKIHFMGLLSDGGVHSHNEHLYALLKLAKIKGMQNDAYIHCFLDGRDVSPTSGKGFLENLITEINKQKSGKIASICGRYFVMDRDNRWDRVEKAYNMLVKGEGEKTDNIEKYMSSSYASKITDEFILPTNILNNGKTTVIEEGDSVIFFNFRPDRAREITRCLTEKVFDNFKREKDLNLDYVCFTQYDLTFTNVKVAFKPQSLDNTLGEYLSKNGLTQLRIAETEKYAHVTFFFNGGVEKANAGEDRALISSPNVATYDLKPEMSAFELTDKVLSLIDEDKYDVIILNYANCDMVGHTGIIEAAVEAVKVVDTCVQKVVDKILEKNGNVLITADHGNADKMLDTDGSVFTAHTTNRVPIIYVSNEKNKTINSGILADIAPTLLSLLNLKTPTEMTGKNLIKN